LAGVVLLGFGEVVVVEVVGRTDIERGGVIIAETMIGIRTIE